MIKTQNTSVKITDQFWYLNDNMLHTLGALGISMNKDVAKNEMRLPASKLVGMSIAFSLTVSNKYSRLTCPKDGVIRRNYAFQIYKWLTCSFNESSSGNGKHMAQSDANNSGWWHPNKPSPSNTRFVEQLIMSKILLSMNPSTEEQKQLKYNRSISSVAHLELFIITSFAKISIISWSKMTTFSRWASLFSNYTKSQR